MSGVKGLLARFENGNLAAASTPPERGRSPAESLGAGSNGTSPRPLSKVRTSFVTVENKSGQIGLRRDTSGEPSSSSQRRASFSQDEEVKKPVLDRKQSYQEELQLRKDSKVNAANTIPEVAVEMEETEQPVTRGRDPAKRKEVVKPKEEVKQKEETKVPAVVTKETSNTNGTSKPAAHKEPTKASSSRLATKPAPISTAKSTLAPKPSPRVTKSPMPKTPTTPKASYHSNMAEKQPEKKPARASSASMQTRTPTTTAAHGSAFKTRIGASPPQTGFVKPKPRSPTRPIKLPASLTAHTASSGSKTAVAPSQRTESRSGFSRASAHPPQVTNSLRTAQTQNRSPSRISTTSTKGSAALVRNSSRLGRTTASRSSIGPPPTSQLQKKPSRQSLPAAADDGFLARMMRSTASSASKTADKGPVTPPKVTQPVKRPVAKHDPPKISLPMREKKVVAKAGPSIAKAKEVVGEAAKSVKSVVKAPVEEKKDTPVKKTSVSKAVLEEAEPQEPAATIATPVEAAPVVMEDLPAAEEKVVEAPVAQEEIKEAETAPKEKEEETPAEQEAESEPEFTPAESVEENAFTSEPATTEEPVPETKEIEQESTITPEPIVETKEEPTPSAPVTEAKPEEEEAEQTVESEKEEEDTVVTPPTEATSPSPSEPTITLPAVEPLPEVKHEEENETAPAVIPTPEVLAVEVKSPALSAISPTESKPSTPNFFTQHASMWGRKTEEKPVLKSTESEDAEDAKAREEIAMLNAAFAKEKAGEDVE